MGICDEDGEVIDALAAKRRDANRIRMAKYCAENREEVNARMREWKRNNAEKVRAQRRKYAEKQGRTYDPSRKCDAITPKWKLLKYDSAADMQRMVYAPARNAREAFDYWIKAKAPDGWVARYFKAMGKPWLNPRLSDAVQYRIKYKVDAEFQIGERLRRQMTKAKKKDGIADVMRSAINRSGRSTTIEKRLGYSVKDLMDHIERQFTKGMNWEAFRSGEIHIDHIVPQSSFDTSNKSEWMSCWCLSNLRPMWARANLEKRDKRLYLL